MEVYAASAAPSQDFASAGRDVNQAGGEATSEDASAGKAVGSARAAITLEGTTVRSLRGIVSICSVLIIWMLIVQFWRIWRKNEREWNLLGHDTLGR